MLLLHPHRGGAVKTIPAFALILLFCACASAGRSESGRGDPKLITKEEILGTGEETIYEVVYRLRHEWLSGTGFMGPRTPVVYRDHFRLGGVEALRTITADRVHSVQWLDPLEAAGVFPDPEVDGNISGVIVVWTTPPDRR